MLANHLYSVLLKQVNQLRPGERITRLRNMSWLMVGIYLSRSVHLSKIALKIPGRAKVPSITRRLTRFLDNPAIRVREWFEPIARAILQAGCLNRGGNPADCRWDQGRLWTSAADRQPGFPPKSHSHRLDVGQDPPRPQFRHQAIGSAGLRPAVDSPGHPGPAGRR
jgi:hypothetical protein